MTKERREHTILLCQAQKARGVVALVVEKPFREGLIFKMQIKDDDDWKLSGLTKYAMAQGREFVFCCY
jgi:hypothetical protein